MDFYQLQTVSCYDFGKSSIKLDEYLSRLEKYGYKGGGIADYNSLISFPYLYKTFKKSELKSIYSTIIKVKIKDYYFYLDLIILNEDGYISLVKLYNLHKDEYSIEDLINHNKGVACVIKTEDDNFKNIMFLEEYAYVFNDLSKIYDDFYFGIEIYSDLDSKFIDTLRDFINERGYKSIAFPKVIYIDKDKGFKAYKILNAIIDDKKLTQDDLLNPGPFFLLSTNVLSKIYTNNEIDSINDLVNKISFNFMKTRGGLLEFKDIDTKKELHDLSIKGLKNKLGESIPSNYLDRLNYELDIIDKMNFNSYFLIVGDYVNYFRNSDVKIGPGRGSCVGSLVSYSLNITLIDPLKYDLLFERFLNLLRQGMPDIDIDVEPNKREEVFNYFRNKYGDDKVSLILTFSNLKVKSSLKRIGMVFSDIPDQRVETLSKLILPKEDDMSFKDILNNNYSFRNKCKDIYYQQIVKLANLIMNYPINTSIHASGVIISKDSLFDLVPTKIGTINTSLYEYETLEEMGFLKLDVLALNNLTFLHDIENLILEHNKKLINPYSNLNDKKTYEILNDLDVVDIFQLDTYSGKEVLRQIKVNSINDLSLVLALNRPGPSKNVPIFAKRKNENEPYKLVSPILEEILRPTYGILVYQEQIIKIATKLALFDPSKADQFRKAVSKKNASKMLALKQEFVDGCIKNNISEKDALNIFDLIEQFAEYGFNRSHSVAYSFISYALAFYKANYIEEFYKVSLDKTNIPSNKFMALYNELRKRSIDIVNPNINISNLDSVYLKGNFYLGLSSIKGFDKNLSNKIIQERETNGKYLSLVDFLSRIDLENLSPIQMSNFINSGVLDEFNYSRDSLLENIHNIQMSFKFNVDKSNNMLPDIKLKDSKYTTFDYINEVNSLGVNLTMHISDMIQGNRKYQNIFIVKNKPVIYENSTKLELVSKFGGEIVYYPSKLNNIQMGDIVSINDIRSKYYNNEQILINKEKKLYE